MNGAGGMTIKTITGTYASGYVLAAKFAGVSITSSGVIESAAGAADSGAAGGVALLLPNAATVSNSGHIAAGVGGSGVYSRSYGAVGGYGGVGGIGLSSAAVVSANNTGTISGGAGGAGAQGGPQQSFYFSGYSQSVAPAADSLPAKSGGYGGAGGAGVSFSAASTIVNHGAIYGGAGGLGGSGGPGGTAVGPDELMPLPGGPGVPGGAGGAGVVLGAGGDLDNLGRIAGGGGGTGGEGYYGPSDGGPGGAGVVAGRSAHVTNLFLIVGGAGGQAGGADASDGARGDGVQLGAGGTIVNGDVTDALALIEGGVGVQLAGAGEVINYGSIEGTGGDSVDFASRGDRLVAEAGSTFEGPVVGGDGLLELAGGTGTITGLGGTGTLAGAVTATFSGFGGYLIDGPASWTIAGATTLAADQDLTAHGTVTLATGDQLTIDGAMTNAGSVVGAGGVLSDAGTLTNTASGVIDAGQTGGLTLVVNGRTMANLGILESTGAGLLVIEGGAVNNIGGTILAVGKRVNLENVDIIGGVLETEGAAALAVSDGGIVLDGAGAHPVALAGALVVEDQTSLTIQGTIEDEDVIFVKGAADPTDIIVGSGGATLSGGGEVILGDSAASHILAAEVGAVTLTNLDTVSGAGTISDSNLTLVNGESGVINADDTVALVISTGADTVVNAGLVEASGSGGAVVKSALDNSGLLFANGGSLTVDGAVTGKGTALVDHATLDFASAFSENVLFLGHGGALELARSQAYSGAITGFSTNGGEDLDLRDIDFGAGTKASYAGSATSGVLTVTDGTHAAKIELIGDYLASTFVTASDGHGGTMVTTTGPSAGAAAAHRFIAAAAALGAGAESSTAIAHQAPALHLPVLATHGGAAF